MCALRNTLILMLVILSGGSNFAAEWTIPLAGNAYRTEPTRGNEGFSRQGPIRFGQRNEVISVFFHVNTESKLNLAIKASAIDAPAKVTAIFKDQKFDFTVQQREPSLVSIGQVSVSQAGYAKLDLRPATKAPIEIHELVVTSNSDDLELSFVASNEGNMFYWGRRGPSVHLRYSVPQGKALTYAYSELTVPETLDPLGTFYMANGFGEGYFGMQVNGPSERRVLFSIWSPFRTDNPREIPADQRIVALGKGNGVHLGEFGNEGSGGQSYLIYPWKAGRTYRFLTEVIPTGNQETTYTSWFGDKEKQEWLLIASFRRPKTDTHLRGFHSFLESFYPTHGHLERRGHYGNVWVRDTEAQWHACKAATFSVDATGGGKHRLDFSGGTSGDQFYLRNCGFFGETGKAGSRFELENTLHSPPEIDFQDLPR